MAKGFLPYEVDQRLLLPPDLREWLPEGHLALFVLDVVQTLDLSAIVDVHLQKDVRGREAYDPRMMVGLLTYAYCVGIASSRPDACRTRPSVPTTTTTTTTTTHQVVPDFREAVLRVLPPRRLKASHRSR